jgi:hypothetical protein
MLHALLAHASISVVSLLNPVQDASLECFQWVLHFLRSTTSVCGLLLCQVTEHLRARVAG